MGYVINPGRPESYETDDSRDAFATAHDMALRSTKPGETFKVYRFNFDTCERGRLLDTYHSQAK